MKMLARLSRPLGAAVAVVLVLSLAPVAHAATEPVQVVEKFHSNLLYVMKNAKSLGYQGRVRALSPAIGEAFHLPAMSRIVAGRTNWKTFSKDEKSAFIDAFSQMTTATYANRFKGYSGETFRTLESVPVRSKTILVKASLTKSNGEVIDINYLVRRFSSGWRVIDVFLKGSISELATRKSEYGTILRKQGIGGLLREIRSRVASLEANAR